MIRNTVCKQSPQQVSPALYCAFPRQHRDGPLSRGKRGEFQRVSVISCASLCVSPSAGERVFMEISRKFTREDVAAMAQGSGFVLYDRWSSDYYGMQVLQCCPLLRLLPGCARRQEVAESDLPC